MTPEALVLAMNKELYEWERWVIANEPDDDPEVEEDEEALEEIERRYFEIFDKYAIDRSVFKGIRWHDIYNKDEKILHVENKNDKVAVVRTKQTIEPNDEVEIKLKKTDNGWRVTERKLIDPNDGEAFDVGI